MTPLFRCVHYSCTLTVSACQARQAKYDNTPKTRRQTLITGRSLQLYDYCGQKCEQKREVGTIC